MDDKFILMGLNDERSKQIAEVLKNKTCKKIIDFLADTKEASEKDIAKDLDIPINTVEYNLKNLTKTGLVEKSKNYFWSVKGKKIPTYKLAKKHIIISPSKKPNLNYLKSILPIIAIVGLFILINAFFFSSVQDQPTGLSRFESEAQLIKAFEDAQDSYSYYRGGVLFGAEDMVLEAATAVSDTSVKSGGDYSQTNIQVQGVDEADIVKTDGEYIYTLGSGKLVIVRAYPPESAEVISEVNFGDFRASELFIHEDRLLVFGTEYHKFVYDEPVVYDETVACDSETEGCVVPPRRYLNTMSVKLYDISDKSSPEVLKSVDLEGYYLTSRKINSDVYFVVNTYPYYNYYNRGEPVFEDMVPLYREINSEKDLELDDMKPIADVTDIGYVDPVQAESFITIASISMIHENRGVKKETIVGSGEEVYASPENLYIAQSSWPGWGVIGELVERNYEKTIITKFKLDDGNIEFSGTGEVKGHILNQFSMDEHDDHFRIATTISRSSDAQTNNIYILDRNLELTGKIEGLAEGERIYSARFMGDRGYMVTFKQVDPLFVLDLSDPESPKVLGELKIPGYSDYLHPYDENHIIGIGKDTEVTEGDWVLFQGVKMALFDVSDVENPIELHKVVIGERGTDSEALYDHKAFLFDKDRNLLIDLSSSKMGSIGCVKCPHILS